MWGGEVRVRAREPPIVGMEVRGARSDMTGGEEGIAHERERALTKADSFRRPVKVHDVRSVFDLAQEIPATIDS